jgi:hypothetical protein
MESNMKTLRCKTFDHPLPLRRPAPVTKPRPATKDAASASKPGRILVAVYGPGQFELETDANGIARLYQVYTATDTKGTTTVTKPPKATTDAHRGALAAKAANAAADVLSGFNAANRQFWGR